MIPGLDNLPLRDVLEWLKGVQAKLAPGRPLVDFVKIAWAEVEARPYQHNWHIEAVCEHLEAVNRGEIRALMIAIPPRHSKSLLTTIFWPAWTWLARRADMPISGPRTSFAFASWSSSLSTDHNMMLRRLIDTPWYRQAAGEGFGVDSKLDRSDDFRLVTGGRAFATSVNSTVTGYGFDVRVADDPNNLGSIDSVADRKAVTRWYDEVWKSRVEDPKRSAEVVIMQRAHKGDLIGHILDGARAADFTLLCLPAEYEPDHPHVWKGDRRTRLGQLLDEERFGKTGYGTIAPATAFARAAQMQQNPVARGGNIFAKAQWQFAEDFPRSIRLVRWWDKAATAEGGGGDPDYTAGALGGFDNNGLFWLVDMIRGRWSSREVEQRIRLTAHEIDGRHIPIWIEEEPGSAGKPMDEKTPVLMADGSYRRLSLVRPGDAVITHRGRAKLVSEVHEQGELPILEVTTESGRVLRAAYDHPFLTPSGWVKAVDLRAGMALGLVVPSGLASAGSQRRAEEFRLAGYFIGDGAVGPSGAGSCCASITCVDPEQIDDLRHCADVLGFKMVKTGKTRGDKDWTFSKGVRPWLRSTGLAGKRAWDKVVPEWVFTAPPEMAAHFIGAYFACDGHVSKTKAGRGLEFYSISRDLLVGVQRLLIRFGIGSKLRKKEIAWHHETGRHVSYRLSLLASDDSQARFAERIPVYGVKSRWLNGGGFDRRRFDEPIMADMIVSVAPAEPALCRCLSVADDASFVADDVAVHNSDIDRFHRVLRGFAMRGDRATGSKLTRVDPFLAAAEAGNVVLVNKRYLGNGRGVGGDPASWLATFLAECDEFTGDDAGHDDQVVAAVGAFNRAAASGTVTAGRMLGV